MMRNECGGWKSQTLRGELQANTYTQGNKIHTDLKVRIPSKDTHQEDMRLDMDHKDNTWTSERAIVEAF